MSCHEWSNVQSEYDSNVPESYVASILLNYKFNSISISSLLILQPHFWMWKWRLAVKNSPPPEMKSIISLSKEMNAQPLFIHFIWRENEIKFSSLQQYCPYNNHQFQSKLKLYPFQFQGILSFLLNGLFRGFNVPFPLPFVLNVTNRTIVMGIMFCDIFFIRILVIIGISTSVIGRSVSFPKLDNAGVKFKQIQVIYNPIGFCIARLQLQNNFFVVLNSL